MESALRIAFIVINSLPHKAKGACQTKASCRDCLSGTSNFEALKFANFQLFRPLNWLVNQYGTDIRSYQV
jgi:hypothetical protein